MIFYMPATMKKGKEQEEAQWDIGDIVQLEEVATSNIRRYSTKVIGYVPGKSVIVMTPLIDGKVAIIRENQRFNVRMLTGSNIKGFVTNILSTQLRPYPYMHISLPKEMESIVVRNAKRVQTDMVVAVQTIHGADKTWIKSRFIDISYSGAKLMTPKPLARPGQNISVMFEVVVLEEKETLTLPAIVRSHNEVEIAKGDRRFVSGIEFSQLNRFQKLLLHAYIMENA